jgi:hypothetical protein
VSYVWLKNRWVAYPFQNNISALDKEDQVGMQGLAAIVAGGCTWVQRSGRRSGGVDCHLGCQFHSAEYGLLQQPG